MRHRFCLPLLQRAAASLLLVALLPLAHVAVAPAAGASTGQHFTVAPWGSDHAAGTAEDPFATVQHGMDQLRPGDTLTVRGGTYPERVVMSYSGITPGLPDAPITVQAYPGERPVIQGRLRLSGADHWTIRGINVTWSDANTSNEHMVQFRGGTGWRFTDAEIWGARSFSAINVDDGARDFSLDHLYVHHTYPANGLNQDHLIYVASGNQGGVIERNVLAHSENGRGVKVGPGSLTEPASDNVVIRYNTFYNNTGPSNVRFSGDSSNNEVYGNLMVEPKAGLAAVTAWELTGTGNTVHDNAAWESDGVVDQTAGLTDGGNNVMVDPAFADPANGDYTPTNPAATNYGAHAPGDTGSGDTALPAPSTTSRRAESFVRAVTTDFLRRSPTDRELVHWRDRLLAGSSRSEMTTAFAYSEEWIGVLVDGYYRSTLGRAADAGGRRYWTRVIASGVTPAEVASHFYGSDEYFRRAGGTHLRWVADLYAEILERTPDAGGVGFWAGLAGSGTSRAAIAHGFYQSAESRRDRVQSLYRTLLDRDAERAGAEHWVGVLANGRDVELATFLASSSEYFDRAGSRFP